MSWFAGIFEVIGCILIGNKDKNGFLYALVCNVLWIYIGVKNFSNPNIAGILVVVIPMLFINVRNYIRWKKSEEI